MKLLEFNVIPNITEDKLYQNNEVVECAIVDLHTSQITVTLSDCTELEKDELYRILRIAAMEKVTCSCCGKQIIKFGSAFMNGVAGEKLYVCRECIVPGGSR